LNALQQGVDAWNAWRGYHPAKPDLDEAYLMGADLSEAGLNGLTSERRTSTGRTSAGRISEMRT
jgi:hypothetical protein